MPTYQVKCNNAKYDKEYGVLVLNCWFYGLEQPRVVCFSKTDFFYKVPGQAPPDEEMIKTAGMFVDKKFNLVIDDDPSTNKVSYEDFYKRFSSEVGEHMEKVTQDLQDDGKQIMRKLGTLMDEGKLNVHDLIKSELGIRAKLGKINE